MFNWRYSMLPLVFIASTAWATSSMESIPNVGGEQRYQALLALARDGNTEQALVLLADLRARFPESDRYFYDYIVILGWAERDLEVLQHAEPLTLMQLPPYLLESFGKSARNLRQYERAIQFYQIAIELAPQRLQSRVGLALALSDNRQGEAALTVFDGLTATSAADSIAMLEALAYAEVSRKRYFVALARYDEILRQAPGQRNALRGRILMTHRLGAPHLAASMARANPGLLTVNEMAAIENDEAAISIRWGRMITPSAEVDKAPARLASAIIYLERRLALLAEDGLKSNLQYQRTGFDLMVALQVARRMDEVIALYQRFVAQGVVFSPHALTAAADAYLVLEQPHKARDLYIEVLALGVTDLAVHLSLFYAYIECEEHENAIRLIDRLNQQQPRWKRLMGTPRQQSNPDKVALEITAAYARAYSDDLVNAQQRLTPLHRQAPANIDLRSSLAYIYLWRGWPRRALEEFEIAGLQNKRHLDSLVGRYQARYALNEFPLAEQALSTLNDHYPRSFRLNNVNRQWQLHNMRELRIEAARGVSSGVQEGSRDLTLNTHLYGRPIKYRYRPYLHHLYSQARFPEGTAYYKRIGVGVEYRGRDLEVRSELARNLGSSADIGLNSEARWMVNDYWSLTANLDSYSNDVPLRGRRVGVDGRGAGLGVAYRADELRRIDVALSWSDFSDQNRRQSAGITLRQRLVTRPDYKLAGIASLNASSNTRDAAPYFNPSRDLTMELGIDNEWLLKRHYDYSYRHRLGIMLGQYQQQSFKDRKIWTVRYEHQWNFNDRTELRYALAHGQRSYDGVVEFNTVVDLTFVWRF